jgi:hypothetical protein
LGRHAERVGEASGLQHADSLAWRANGGSKEPPAIIAG